MPSFVHFVIFALRKNHTTLFMHWNFSDPKFISMPWRKPVARK